MVQVINKFCLILLLLVLLQNASYSDEEAVLRKRFEELHSLFVKFDGTVGNVDVLLSGIPEVKELLELGVPIVPYIVEKVRTYKYKYRHTMCSVLIIIANALLADSPIGSDEEIELYAKIFGGPLVGIKIDKWLKWWEKEGKKLYEKRLAEYRQLKEYLKNPKPPRFEPPESELPRMPPPKPPDFEPPESEPPLPAEEPTPLSLEPIEWTELPRIPPSTPPEFVVKEVPEHKPVSRLKPEVEQPKTPIFVLVVTLIVIIAILIALFYTYFRR